MVKDIFINENKEQVLDLSKWDLYCEKKDFEKGYFSKYYKRKDSNEKELSIGIFYNFKDPDDIEYVAWGYRDEKDCSFNAKIKENKYIIDIKVGCPCSE